MINLENTPNIRSDLASHYVELERFINTFISLRETFEEMRIRHCELVEVIQKTEATKRETELLKQAINKTAMDYGLAPILDGDKTTQ